MKYLLLAPSLLACGVLAVWPLVELVRVSMLRTDFITSRYVGLANYARVFADPAFIQTATNSLAYMGVMVTITIGGALGVALLAMRERKRLQDLVRVLLYLPVISAGIIIAQVWRWFFHVNGPINWMLGTDINWFGQGVMAIPAIGLIVATSGLGGTLIVILAAILSVDSSLYDAARIDGCSWRQIKFRIVVPCIAPTLAVMTLITVIAAPQVFETIYALAPFEYAATTGWLIYREAFQMSRHGTAAAMSMVLLVAMFTVAMVKQRLARE